MPNYRHNAPEYARRNSYGRSYAGDTTPGGQRGQTPREGDACKEEHDNRKEVPLAMAYVRWQEWRDLYEPEKGFSRGTIFKELDMPFLGTGECIR